MTDSTTEDEMLAQAIAMSLEAEQQAASRQQTSAMSGGLNGLSSKGEQPPPPTTHPHPGTPQVPPGQVGTGERSQFSEEAAEIAQAILSRSEPEIPQGHSSDLPPAKMMREWQPNKECLDLVMGMGISENAARRALYNTGNDNAELATSWVFENIDNPQLHEPFNPPPMTALPHVPGGGGPVWHSFDEAVHQLQVNAEMYKMVFVVNNSLRMGVGKVAAQVGHATLALYQLLQTQPRWKEDSAKWEDTACKKIVVQGQSTHHLLELKHKAYEQRLPNIIVHDAGRTQVEPGSLTVFAVFGKTSEVDSVTGNLKLL